MKKFFYLTMLLFGIASAASASGSTDLTGQWTTVGANGTTTMRETVNLIQTGSRISGTFSYTIGNATCDPLPASGNVTGSVSGQQVTFTLTQTSAIQKCSNGVATGGAGYAVTIVANLSGDALQVVSDSCMFVSGTNCVARYVSYLRTLESGGPAPFDPTLGIPATLPSVVQSVAPSGTAASMSLTATMKFDDSIKGKTGSIFVGARVPVYANGNGLNVGRNATELRQPQNAATETWYLSNGSSWSQLGTTIPAHFTGALDDANALVNILDGANTAGLCGVEFYVGYGTSSSAMLANNTLGKVYTVMCNFDFTGSASGSTSSLTLSANTQVATADAGKNGNFYLGRLLNNQWTLHNGSGWGAYNGGAVPVYASGVLSSRQIQVFSNENVQNLMGAQIYVGYGLDDADLLTNKKYRLVYTIQ
jgi:hypothetical protein